MTRSSMSGPKNLLSELAERYAQGIQEVAPWAWLTGAAVVLAAPYFLRSRPELVSRLRLLLVAPLAVGAVIWGYHWLWFGDDAFISFRYARNLAEGHGLVYNPGERVEGYTNFLWTVLLGAGTAAGISPLMLSTILSLAAFAAVVVLVTWLAARLAPPESPVVVSAAAVVTAASYVMASFATSGLETMFAAALALGMLAFASTGRWGLAGLSGIGAALSHPDHILLYGAMGIALLLERVTFREPLQWWKDPSRRARLVRFALPLVAVFVPYYLARWAYYGDFYPNTYYAKSGGEAYFKQGGRYLLITLFASGAFVALPLSLYGAARRWSRVEARYVLVALPLFCTYVAKIGGDFMLGRLFVPVLPLVFLFAECTARDLFAARRRWVRPLGLVALWGLLLGAVPVRVIRDGEKYFHVSDEGSFFRATKPTLDGVNEFYRSRANDLNRFVLPRVDALLGIGNLGIVGYIAPARIRDLFGLTDRSVAHMPIATRARPGHEKIARAPFLLIHQVDLSDDPIFPEPYTSLTVMRAGSTDYFMSGFRPKFVEKMRQTKGIRLPRIERYLDAYTPSDPGADEYRAACDLWFMDEFYFRHTPDPARRARVLERVKAQYPALGDAAELALHAGPDVFRAKPLFGLTGQEGWKANGLAFAHFPTTGIVPDQGFVYGETGPFANSFTAKEFDRAQGRLVSPEFPVEGEAITLQVGGGFNARSLHVALVVDDEVVRRATGCNSDALGRRVWNVADLRGKRGRLEIVDGETGGWGHILVDSVTEWSRK
ncbi:MAG TPA: hypothetical protein VFZ53_15455 [Polyangiaceae bacterium]